MRESSRILGFLGGPRARPPEPPPPFTHLAVTKTERRMDSRGLWFMGHLESWSSAVNSVFGHGGGWGPGCP